MEAARDGAAQFAARQQRIDDAIALRQPDRVPVVYYTMFWHARYAGFTCREAMYDYVKLADATRRVVLDLQPDAYALPHPIVALGPAMEALDYRQLQWPGHGTGDDVSYQFLDREYMSADEYEEYLFDPTGFYLQKYLPRIAGGAAGLARLPELPGLYYLQIVHGMRAFADPQVQAAFASLAAAGEEIRKMLHNGMALAQELADLGFPLIQGSTALAPYDYFSDYFRGSRGAMLDMLRRGDLFEQAMEKAAVFITRYATGTARRSPSNIVFIPIHWAFDGLMRESQFKRFFWPPLRKVLLGLIEAGLVPMCLWEGDCSSRLEIIGDIPPGKAIYMFERTDLARAKQVLGDVVCLRGNVPASLLVAGTPDDVDACCRQLIETVGKGGGFILDGGVGIPDEAREANVRAMFAAVEKYG
jgi:uroporphyrinogen-III decarboxylase